MTFATAWQLIRDTLSAFLNDRAERLGAAIAYYATFSFAPLIVLALSIVGVLYNQRDEDAQTALLEEVHRVFGADGAVLIEGVLESTTVTASGPAAFVSSLLLVFGATTLFARLQDALNTIWNTTPSHSGLWAFVRSRVISLMLVVGAGVLIVVSLVFNTLLVSLADALEMPMLVQWLGPIGSVVLLALLFGLLFRTLPDTDVDWATVWPGAIGTAVLFMIGTWAISTYLGLAAPTSAYGAAGALVAFLLWVYVSAQIFFLGAEFTTVYAAYRSRPHSVASVAPSHPSPPPPAVKRPSLPAQVGWFVLGILLFWWMRR